MKTQCPYCKTKFEFSNFVIAKNERIDSNKAYKCPECSAFLKLNWLLFPLILLFVYSALLIHGQVAILVSSVYICILALVTYLLRRHLTFLK
jgi:hypothetical protein